MVSTANSLPFWPWVLPTFCTPWRAEMALVVSVSGFLKKARTSVSCLIEQIQRFMFTSHGAKKWWHGNVHTDLPSLLLVVYNPDDRSLPSLPGEYLHLSKLRRLIWSLCSSLGIFHFWVSHDCGILQTSGHASVLINKGRRSWLYAFIWHLFFLTIF